MNKYVSTSHNRGRRLRARGPRGAIETRAGTRKFAQLSSGISRRLAIVLRLYLSALLTFQMHNISIYNACTVE